MKLTVSICVQEEKYRSAELFLNQYLEIVNEKVPVYLTSKCVLLRYNFCIVVKSEEELTKDVFLRKQFRKVNGIFLPLRTNTFTKLMILISLIIRAKKSRISPPTFCNSDEAINYPVEFLNFLGFSEMSPHVMELKMSMSVIQLRKINYLKFYNAPDLHKK